MNKAELVTALAEHLDGDRRTASAAVDGLLEVIVRTVRTGDSVSLTGFGVFEQRQRAARSGRNPRTGQTIQVPASVVPAFRAGTRFRDVVNGARELGEAPARAARSSGASSRPRSRPVTEATASVAVEEKPAKAASKDAKPSKDGKGGKAAKSKAKSAKGSAGKSAKKKGKK